MCRARVARDEGIDSAKKRDEFFERRFADDVDEFVLAVRSIYDFFGTLPVCFDARHDERRAVFVRNLVAERAVSLRAPFLEPVVACRLYAESDDGLIFFARHAADDFVDRREIFFCCRLESRRIKRLVVVVKIPPHGLLKALGAAVAEVVPPVERDVRRVEVTLPSELPAERLLDGHANRNTREPLHERHALARIDGYANVKFFASEPLRHLPHAEHTTAAFVFVRYDAVDAVDELRRRREWRLREKRDFRVGVMLFQHGKYRCCYHDVAEVHDAVDKYFIRHGLFPPVPSKFRSP